MFLFFKLLPDDVDLINLLPTSRSIKVGIWTTEALEPATLSRRTTNDDYVLESADGEFRMVDAVKSTKKDKVFKKITVAQNIEKSQLARLLIDNPQLFVRTNSTGIIWNFNAKGYLIDPYAPLASGIIPMPDGTELSFLRGGWAIRPSHIGAWITQLGESMKEYTKKPSEKAMVRLTIKSAYRSAQMNLKRRKGDVSDPVVKRVWNSGGYTPAQAVVTHNIRNRRTAISGKKASIGHKRNQLAVKEFRCPLGATCRYAAAGQICQHNKEAFKLAQFFKTRDPDLIIESLASLLSVESERYAKALAIEEDSGTIADFASSIGNDLFRKAIDYLKLVKPEFDSGKAVNIFNMQINASEAAIKLEQAGMNDQQRRSLAEDIEGILKEKRREGTRGTQVASGESGV